jgi:drug/metabolite transporter (DMT)-like permease
MVFIISMAFIVLFGSGFVGAKLGFPYANPLVFLIWRFALSAGMLLILALLFRSKWPSNWVQVGHIAVSGFFLVGLFAVGTWESMNMGLRPAISALIIALQPMVVALASYFFFKAKINKLQWIGLLLGLLGVILVVAEEAIAYLSLEFLEGVLLSFLALFSLAFGSLYQKRYCTEMNVFAGGVIQSISSGLLCLILAAFFHPSFVVHWTGQFIFSMFWMCVALSLGGISCLYLLIQKGESHKVASLFYLIPAVTAVISYFVFHTTLDHIQLMGMAIAMLGVGLVNVKFKRKS